jgi:hypothetical protein
MNEEPALPKYLSAVQSARREVMVNYLQNRSRMQLAMGELTDEEYLAARAAIRYALVQIDRLDMLNVTDNFIGKCDSYPFTL